MKIKKNAMTLLEIMIVIFLIGLISSVVGYSMKGSIDKGRAFKSKEGEKQLRDIFLLKIAEGVPSATVAENPKVYLEDSGLVKNPAKMLKDGWNQPFRIESTEDNDLLIYSIRLQEYEQKKKDKLGDLSQFEDDES